MISILVSVSNSEVLELILVLNSKTFSFGIVLGWILNLENLGIDIGIVLDFGLLRY